MISLIICTGHRPDAFKLCISYLKRQVTRERIQLIVIDDSPAAKELAPYFLELPNNIDPELYQGPELWKPGMNTQAGNMLEAIEKIKGDKVMVWDDDDYYSPNYIELMDRYLNLFDLVGEGNSFYYHLHAGWKRMQNYQHASLAATGFKIELLPQFKSAVTSGNKFFDAELWKTAHNQGKKCAIFTDMRLSVGMKGMPGRAGIGIGHSKEGYVPDQQLGILRRWLGEDAKNYFNFIKGLEYGQAPKPIDASSNKTNSKTTQKGKEGHNQSTKRSVQSGSPSSQNKTNGKTTQRGKEGNNQVSNRSVQSKPSTSKSEEVITFVPKE